jgi:hypothetical protein
MVKNIRHAIEGHSQTPPVRAPDISLRAFMAGRLIRRIPAPVCFANFLRRESAPLIGNRDSLLTGLNEVLAVYFYKLTINIFITLTVGQSSSFSPVSRGDGWIRSERVLAGGKPGRRTRRRGVFMAGIEGREKNFEFRLPMKFQDGDRATE